MADDHFAFFQADKMLSQILRYDSVSRIVKFRWITSSDNFRRGCRHLSVNFRHELFGTEQYHSHRPAPGSDVKEIVEYRPAAAACGGVFIQLVHEDYYLARHFRIVLSSLGVHPIHFDNDVPEYQRSLFVRQVVYIDNYSLATANAPDLFAEIASVSVTVIYENTRLTSLDGTAEEAPEPADAVGAVVANTPDLSIIKNRRSIYQLCPRTYASKRAISIALIAVDQAAKTGQRFRLIGYSREQAEQPRAG